MLAEIHRETLRYYERMDLLPTAKRKTNGYRYYNGEDLERIRFIRRAQSVGFTLDEIKELQQISQRSCGNCHEIHVKAEEKLGLIETKIEELQEMRIQLKRYIGKCSEPQEVEKCHLVHSLKGKEENCHES